MAWNDTSEYTVHLTERQYDNLRELRGFIIGLKAASKDVPGIFAYKEMFDALKKIEKSK